VAGNSRYNEEINSRLRPRWTMQYTLCFLLSAFAVASAAAEPVTRERINSLPAEQQPSWREYLDRSQKNSMADQAAIAAEVAASGMSNALKAPSGGDFKVTARPGDAWFGSDEARRIADAVLSYQTPAGGWSKHTGYSHGPRRPGMQWTSQNEPGRSAHYVATFDNHATTAEMKFLACVWHMTQREDCKAGFLKGLDFILASQFPNGGWPQGYPLEGNYHDHITFNDDAMTHILELLHSIQRREPWFAFVDELKRQEVERALAAALRCVRQLQVVQNGKATAWCAQYDALTMQPAQARLMEPASLSGLESAHVLKFLMTITNPSPEIVTSIEQGLAWLDQAKITSLSRTNRSAKTTYERNSTSTEVYWARFYSLTNSTPIFPGRDGVLYKSFDEMAAHNRLGYDYLTTLPGSILNNGQKKWRRMLNADRK